MSAKISLNIFIGRISGKINNCPKKRAGFFENPDSGKTV